MVVSESSHKHIADELFGTYSMPSGTISSWQIGPMELVVESRAQEWRLHWDYNQLPLSDRFGFNPKHEESYEHMNTERMAYSHKSDTLTIKPQLADRPIVIRPEISFYVPPKEEIKLFLTTPFGSHSNREKVSSEKSPVLGLQTLGSAPWMIVANIVMLQKSLLVLMCMNLKCSIIAPSHRLL